MPIVYFAYGSNMLRERLLARCSTATPQGLATLVDHRLTFDKVSRDDSGKCAFESAKGQVLPGVIWEMEESERNALDRLEGCGHGYEASYIEIADAQVQPLRALTYVATRRDSSRKPYDWYWALVLAGAMQNGLPQSHIERIRAEPRIGDPDSNRKQRLEALAFLEKSGYGGLL
jgi:gamma-glutamylcyclotransferase